MFWIQVGSIRYEWRKPYLTVIKGGTKTPYLVDTHHEAKIFAQNEHPDKVLGEWQHSDE